MTQQTFADPAVTLLERLLALSERSPDRTRPASAAPNYDDLRTAESIARFEARLSAAVNAGAIQLQKGKRERRHLVDRVRVKDPLALARHLGRIPAKANANLMREALASVASKGEPWVGEILQRMAARWSRGEPAYRLSASDSVLATEFISLLVAISKGEAKGLDGRTFSFRVASDSKAFDRHASRIASVLAAQSGEVSLSADQIWTRIGLERFSHPVHIKGCVVVHDQSGILVDGRATPFVSIHPDMVPLVQLSGAPTALLTIENYASFNRYAREVNDGALVVYTGGFPSNGIVELLRLLLTLTGPAVPFFHWGDIDPGGLRIFRFLEESLPRPPQPHLMTRDLAQTHGRPAAGDAALAAIARSTSAVCGLAEWLTASNGVMHLEQEALDPVSPLGRD